MATKNKIVIKEKLQSLIIENNKLEIENQNGLITQKIKP
jgi:hypothetical protein